MKMIKRRNGFTVVEVIVSLSLGLIIAVFGLQIIKMSKNLEVGNQSMHAVDEIRTQILNSLKNKDAIRNTINSPANAVVFACIVGNSDCAAAGGSFTLYDVNNVRVTAAASPGIPGEGFSKNGEICSTYSAAGNDICVFRYDVSWTPRCPSVGPCLNPIVEFYAGLSYSVTGSKEAMVKNLRSYDIQYSSVGSGLSSYDACMKSGGEFNAVTSKCELRLSKPGECAPNHWIVGFLADRSPICQPIIGHACPVGQVLLGFDTVTLEAVCGPGCVSSGSSRGTIW